MRWPFSTEGQSGLWLRRRVCPAPAEPLRLGSNLPVASFPKRQALSFVTPIGSCLLYDLRYHPTLYNLGILNLKARRRFNIDGEVVDEPKQAAETQRSTVQGTDTALVQRETVVLFVDLVESVRLMREQEARTVHRWADFIRKVNEVILPRFDGVVVKNLGDGLMARFETVLGAVKAAGEMHRLIDSLNAGIPENQHFHLRAGVNAAIAWSDGADIYGTGVNLAARLATLASPGEQGCSTLSTERHGEY
jgi:class 3 adenylate cyclase